MSKRKNQKAWAPDELRKQREKNEFGVKFNNFIGVFS